MGNCCKNKPADRPKPAAAQQEPPKIEIVLPDGSVWVRYSADKPVTDLVEQIQLPFGTYSLFKGEEEINDFTATLRQLEIQPRDKLELREKAGRKEADHSVSLEIIAEEESTNRHFVESVQPKFGNAPALRRGQQFASHLWQSASSPVNNQQRMNAADTSSITNKTGDASWKERPVPLEFQVPVRIDLPVDSDDSYLVGDNKPKTQHPTEFIRDLRGPFSIFN